MTWYERTATFLVAIGAINWGLSQLGWNAVASLIGSWSPMLATIVYYLIGISGVWALVKAFQED
jgi:uncharacterized membrane protein YuzA (DUF378 family)